MEFYESILLLYISRLIGDDCHHHDWRLFIVYMIGDDCVFDGTRAFGYSSEDVQMVIETMAAQGKEPTFCMGDDIPLAILSQKPHMLYDYFKQRFAQVCYYLSQTLD